VQNSGTGSDLAARPYTKAPVMIDQVYNWTGLYIGAHVGGAFGTNSWSNVRDPLGADNNNGDDAGNGNVNGVFGGGQVGYNYQMGHFLVGIEGEFSGSDIHGSTHLSTGGADYSATANVKTRWVADVSGRFGAIFQDHMLLYVKGGYAWKENSYNVNVFDFGQVGSYPTLTDRRDGYLIGFGTEYAFDRNWSAKIEYNYMDFGTRTVNFPQGISGTTNDGPFAVDVRDQMHTVKLGVNYRFN
jgi:outer membrane immunogenic protein